MIKNGIVALPTIILISGIIMEIGVALALVVFLMSQSAAGAKYSAEALTMAQSGIADATIKVIRNNNLGSPSASSYTLTVDSLRKTDVVVCKGYLIVDNACGATANAGKTQIISTGKAVNKNRRVQAFLNVNSTTGEIKTESISEISL
ncbi:hypothetical protein HZB05_01395 [Candidatus Wolfebacteria bacterium]|nr:hypothetical protein [Candidatus Wolfebacteria bacterium]